MNNKENCYDWTIKLLIIGDTNVGKTNLLVRACDNKFLPTHLATIGIDFKIKNMEIDGRKIRMQIWDTAGQDRFRTITQNYYKGAQGIIMGYAINDRNSFNNIDMWMKQIKDHASEGVCVMLVGNKCDLQSRTVEFSEGKKLADYYGVPFIETSAKNDINIEETFEIMARNIKEKIAKNESIVQPDPNHGSKLKNNIKGLPENNNESNCTC